MTWGQAVALGGWAEVREGRGSNKATEAQGQMKGKGLDLYTRPGSVPESLDLRKIPLAKS